MKNRKGISDLAYKIICPRCGQGQPGHILDWRVVNGRPVRTLDCPGKEEEEK